MEYHDIAADPSILFKQFKLPNLSFWNMKETSGPVASSLSIESN